MTAKKLSIPDKWLAGYLAGHKGSTVADAVAAWQEQERLADEAQDTDHGAHCPCPDCTAERIERTRENIRARLATVPRKGVFEDYVGCDCPVRRKP